MVHTGKLAAIAAAAVAACGLAAAATAAEFTPALKELIAAAQGEGELTLNWGESTLGGTVGTKIIEQKLNQAYGTKLKFTFTPGQSMPAVGNQILTLQKAGQPSISDVYVAFSRSMSELYKHKPFLAVDWKALSPDRMTDAVVEADGTAVKVVTATPGIVYNTKLAPHKPERLADFLRPEWRGKIAATPYAANFDILSGAALWGPEKTLDFATKLSSQVSGLIRCNETERIASGEFLAFIISCTGTDASRLIAKGAPLAQAIPTDFPITSYFYLSVPKNARHPNAGKLFTVFMLSPEGQRLSWELWDADVHLFPGSNTRKAVDEIEKQAGRKLLNVDIAWQLENETGRANHDTVVKILSKRQ